MTKRIFCLVGVVAVGMTLPLIAEEVVLYGPRAALGAVILPYKKAVELSSGLSLTLVEKNTGKGLCDLVDGKCDASLTTGDLNATLEAAKKWGKDVSLGNLQFRQLANDEIVFFVNPFNPVRKLTVSQVRDIMTGKISNWKEVGGNDAVIDVVLDMTTGTTHAAVKAAVLENRDYVLSCRMQSSNFLVAEQVKENRNAIGAAPARMLDFQQVRAVELDRKIAGSMGVVTFGTPSANVKRILDAFEEEIKKSNKEQRT